MTDPRATDEGAPRLSVIIPAFNVEDWIGLTLESISGQTEQSLEVLVVDDGSSDATRDVVADFSARDERVRLLTNPGTGGAQARNHAIAQARGEFLAFADGDDIVPERAYELLLAQAGISGNDMVVGNHVTSEPQRLAKRSQSLPIYASVRSGLKIDEEPQFLRDRVCWNRIIRRSTWNRLGLEFSDSKRSNDIQAMTRAYCMIPFDVIPEPVYVYRRRVGLTSMTSGKLRADALHDHFTQELGAASAVAALGSKKLTIAYFRGILEFDVWAHGREAARRDDVEFTSVRMLLRDLVSRAPREAMRGLPAHHRLFYTYVAQDDWEAASMLVTRQGRSMVRALDSADAASMVRAALMSDRAMSRSVAWLVRASYLKVIIDEANDISDAELVRFQRQARNLARLGMPKSAFEWRERKILLADSADPSAVRSAARSAQSKSMARLQRYRDAILRAARFEQGDGAPTARQVLALARRVRPRHIAKAGRAAMRMARRRFGH